MITTTRLFSLLLVGGVVAAASAYIGSFMVLKRMSLVGDALSHVALPGMAIAIAMNLSPILGAFVFLILAVLLIWYLQETTKVYTEALVGVMFTASLAIGVLLTKQPDLLEALFGSVEKIDTMESVSVLLISILIIYFLYKISKDLTLTTLSEDVSRTIGIETKRINLYYLLLVGSIVAVGVRFVGTLLVGALVIIPSASAKNIAKSLKQYILYSIIFGVTSAVSGMFMSFFLQIETGPFVVLASVVIFVITYIFKSK